ncbi:MAG: hypothetical protein RIC36_00130 [Rhodospirillales bacterium]
MNEQLELTLGFIDEQPRAAADIISAATPSEGGAFLAFAPLRSAVRLVENLQPWSAALILAETPMERTAAILRDISYADAAAILRHVAEAERAKILENLPARLSRDIERSLSYPVMTVGAWMDVSTPYFKATTTAGDCLKGLRNQGESCGGMAIVTGRGRRFTGVVDLEQLLLLQDDQPIGDIMDTGFTPLSARASLSMAHGNAGWRRFSGLPVINRRNDVMGLLRQGSLEQAEKLVVPASLPRSGDSIAGHLATGFVITLSGFIQLLSPDSRQQHSASRKR